MTSPRIAMIFVVLIALVLTQTASDTASANRWSGPAGLTATLSGGEVGLSWTPGTNPRYVTQTVKRRDPGVRPAVWTDFEVELTASSYTDASVEDGKRYIYRIRAEKANGKGGVSNVARVTIPEAIVLRATVSAVPNSLPTYDRGDWRHWIDADGDCQDARQEVLIAESVTTVTYETSSDCRVETGTWNAPFTGSTVTDPSGLDVDHMVPLKNAHQSGGWNWSAEKKKQYANYLDDPQHLIAVTSSANRSKGSRGPDEWKPTQRSYWCQYATDWVSIKATWELTVTADEVTALREMFGTCPGSVTLETTEDDSTPETPETTVYESCAAAEEAGEERIQGSKGSGRGFPKAMVPSARDGDGDGVVCER